MPVPRSEELNRTTFPRRDPDVAPSWRYVPGRALRRFADDGFTDFVGSLSFRGLLALFPGLIAFVSVLGLFGQSEDAVLRLLNEAEEVTPEHSWDAVRPLLETLLRTQSAGLGLAIGLVTTLWAASGYVKTFSRTMNAVYGTREGRGALRWNLHMYLLTVLFMLLIAVGFTGVLLGGPVAEAVGAFIGLQSVVLTVWKYTRWVVVFLAVVLLVGLLYRTTPNVRLRRGPDGRRTGWVSVGSFVAIVMTVVATMLFLFYVAKVPYYSSTYGALAGVIVLMLWMFIVNAALVFGAVVDGEMERVRQLREGLAAEETLYLQLRDTRGTDRREIRAARDVERAREVRRSVGGGEDAGDEM
ncbi:YihY/virulence factor BrkB family protein [Corynebacterium terpenotabidum]|uniref:Uncharacterized protein n=1 Tax=Corynebacterium terpenotabidum Y-11 TaxID=1200352 RepID=S4XBP8_9CORY|nr:YihY/virulence factor BrkB family protein [Corynebacterium terpenotabidum]AGP29889.1 hypothetical protein A606_01170 [Corynebacterium terpenotabidum Y-11]